MNQRHHTARAFAAAAFVTLLAATAARAQTNTTYVTANRGADINPCSRTAPCRTITKGLAAAAAGGTVVILDSGEYEPFVVSKSATIAAQPGVEAVIKAAGAPVVRVNASETDAVTLRGLTLKGPSSTFGIDVSQAGSVSIEGFTITNFDQGVGVSVMTRVYIRDTLFKGNGVGLFVLPIVEGPGADVSVENCRFEDNEYGIKADTWVAPNTNYSLTVARSSFNGNKYGITLDDSGNATPRVSVIASVFTRNIGSQVCDDFGCRWIGGAIFNHGSTLELVLSDNTLLQSLSGVRGRYHSFKNNRITPGTSDDPESAFDVK